MDAQERNNHLSFGIMHRKIIANFWVKMSIEAIEGFEKRYFTVPTLPF